MQKKETIAPTKLCIITILNSLCSVYITFAGTGDEMGGAEPSKQQQADCLPGQSQLEHITSAVVGHVTSPDNSLTTVMQGLKVVLSVAQYNAGQVQLFSLLKSGVSGFSQLLVRLMESSGGAAGPSLGSDPGPGWNGDRLPGRAAESGAGGVA
jgi:hypothetical protein